MTRKTDNLRIKNDKRKKLSDEDKALILRFKDEGKAKNWVAKYFEVNKRTIDFIWFPEKLEESKRLRRERLLFDKHRYYDKDKHRESISDLRKRKKQENIELFTKKCKACGNLFIEKSANQLFCSKRCRWNYGNWKKHGTLEKHLTNNKGENNGQRNI